MSQDTGSSMNAVGWFVVGLFVVALVTNGQFWPRLVAAVQHTDASELRREQPVDAATAGDVDDIMRVLRGFDLSRHLDNNHDDNDKQTMKGRGER